jgi:hypothetical protein
MVVWNIAAKEFGIDCGESLSEAKMWTEVGVPFPSNLPTLKERHRYDANPGEFGTTDFHLHDRITSVKIAPHFLLQSGQILSRVVE